MKPENFMFSEISQQERKNITGVQLYELSRIDRFIKTESKVLVAGAGGVGGVGSCLMGARLQFGAMKKFCRMDTGDGRHNLMNVLNDTEHFETIKVVT